MLIFVLFLNPNTFCCKNFLIISHLWKYVSTNCFSFILSGLSSNKCIASGFVHFNGKTIDHINGDSLNNDPQNLRLVTASENKLNSKIHKNNTTGHKNIFFREKYKSYNCGITINGKQKHIGSYNTLEEALKARNSYIEHLKETIGDYFRIWKQY